MSVFFLGRLLTGAFLRAVNGVDFRPESGMLIRSFPCIYRKKLIKVYRFFNVLYT